MSIRIPPRAPKIATPQAPSDNPSIGTTSLVQHAIDQKFAPDVMLGLIKPSGSLQEYWKKHHALKDANGNFITDQMPPSWAAYAKKHGL